MRLATRLEGVEVVRGSSTWCQVGGVREVERCTDAGQRAPHCCARCASVSTWRACVLAAQHMSARILLRCCWGGRVHAWAVPAFAMPTWHVMCVACHACLHARVLTPACLSANPAHVSPQLLLPCWPRVRKERVCMERKEAWRVCSRSLIAFEAGRHAHTPRIRPWWLLCCAGGGGCCCPGAV